MAITTPTQAYLFNGDATDELGDTNGTLDGATLASGSIAWAYDFDGTNDKIDLGTSLLGNADFSASFMFKCDAVNGNYYIIGRDASFFFGPWAGGTNEIAFRIYDGSAWHVVTAAFSDTASWHHGVITWDKSAGDLHMYIDGTDNSNLSGATTMAGSTNALQFGAYEPVSDGRWFNGKIGPSFLWEGTVLSGAEVSELYNSGTPKIYTATNGWIDDTSLEYGILTASKLESTSVVDDVAGNDGSVSGTSVTTGIINNGLSVNGTTDVINIPLNHLPQSFTFAFWFNPTTMATADMISIKQDASPFTKRGFYMQWFTGGDITFNVRNSANTTWYGGTASGVMTSTGVWYHVVGRRDADSPEISLFINGTENSLDTSSFTGLSADEPIRLGNTASSANAPVGVFDEPKFWARALSNTEITEIYNKGHPGVSQQYPFHSNLPTPVAAYLFNGDATDETGTNDGTINGATLTAGNTAWGYTFDGTNDEINVPNDSSLQVTDFSASCWVKFAGTPNFDMILGKNHVGAGGTGTGWPQIFIDPDDKIDFRGTYDTTGTKSTTVLTSGTWYHVVCTYDASAAGGTEKIYVNGVLEGTGTGKGSISNNTDEMHIGSRGTTQWFEGDISDMFIFDVALTDAQVSEIYNAGNSKIYSGAKSQWIDPAELEWGSKVYYKLEGLTEEVVGYDLTNNGTTGFATGIIGNGADFDASTKWLETSDYIYGNSWSVWFYSNATATGRIWNKDFTDGATRDWYIELTSGGAISTQMHDTTNGFEGDATGTYSPTTWTHVAVVNQEGGGWKSYKNGALIATWGSGTSPTETTNKFQIGQRNSGVSTNPFDGLVDEAFVTNNRLTATQVAELYAAGSPDNNQQYPFPAAGTGFLIASINGIAPALIAKINGVAIASISKFNGVTIQ